MEQIKTIEEYKEALKRFDYLINTVPDTEAGKNSSEGQELIALAAELERYEKKTWEEN